MARKPNIYQARAVVQVDSEQANPDLISSERRRSALNDPSYFNTQLQLLTSESLLRRVIKEHNLETNKEFYTVKNEESVSVWRSMLKAVGLSSDDKKKEEKGIGEVTQSANSTLASSEQIAEAIRLAPFVTTLKNNLSHRTGQRSARGEQRYAPDRSLLSSFQSELAAYVVNGIVETFSRQNQEKRTGTSTKTSDFLNERVNALQSEIQANENKLVKMKGELGIINTEGEQTVVGDRLSGLNKQRLEAENNRKNAEAQYNSVRNSPESLKSQAEELAQRYFAERETVIRGIINEAEKKIGDLKAYKAKLLQEYQETAYEVQEVTTQINSLEESVAKTVQKNKTDLENYRAQTTKTLLDNLRTRYITAKQHEDQILAAYNQQFNQAQGEEQSAVKVKLLEQDIETKKGFLKELSASQKENDIVAVGTDNNISVTEVAIPPAEPISPRRLTTVIAALFLSTLFGMGVALFLEYLDDTIRTTEEIENYLQLPALAAIPTIDSMPKRRLLLVGGGGNEESGDEAKSQLLIHSDSRSALAEAYRQLRTSICFRPPDTRRNRF
jgi:uncharacterized protein involved in exopolysaccharide biosynthesis